MKNKKRIQGLAALLVIALAIVLLPVQEAKANYIYNDECPFCHTGRLHIEPNDEGFYHYYECDNPDCPEEGKEPCFGGDATCMTPGECVSCCDSYYAPP